MRESMSQKRYEYKSDKRRSYGSQSIDTRGFHEVTNESDIAIISCLIYLELYCPTLFAYYWDNPRRLLMNSYRIYNKIKRNGMMTIVEACKCRPLIDGFCW